MHTLEFDQQTDQALSDALDAAFHNSCRSE